VRVGSVRDVSRVLRVDWLQRVGSRPQDLFTRAQYRHFARIEGIEIQTTDIVSWHSRALAACLRGVAVCRVGGGRASAGLGKDRACASALRHHVGAKYRKFKRPFRAVCAVARGGSSVGLAVVGTSLQSIWAG